MYLIELLTLSSRNPESLRRARVSHHAFATRTADVHVHAHGNVATCSVLYHVREHVGLSIYMHAQKQSSPILQVRVKLHYQ